MVPAPGRGSSSRLSARRLTAVLAVAWLALAVKLILAMVTTGSNDVGTFFRFGTYIREHGLGAMYRSDPEFNHLPLTGIYCALTVTLPWFPFWIRLPGIVADFVTVRAVLRAGVGGRTPPLWALLAFAASPVSLLVSGFHGNVDPIMVMALVLATIAATEDRPLASGSWLALAANVKVAALLLAPLLLLFWLHRGRGRAFLPSFVGLTAVGWMPALIAAPREFADQVLAYSGRWGSWGFSWVLSRLGGVLEPLPSFGAFTSAQSFIISLAKVAILGVTLLLAWRGRAASGLGICSVAALTWATFFALAPTGGPQYLVWIAPFVLMASPRWYLLITIASTVMLVAFYGYTSGWGFDVSHSTALVESRWLPWTTVPWLAITAYALTALREAAQPAGRAAGGWLQPRRTRARAPESPAGVPAPPSE